MQPFNTVAFKEWAAVCDALAAGRKTIILRKGGIHEGRDGFRVAHREFWLFPTHFHQSSDSLIPEAQPFAERSNARAADDDMVRLGLYAVVQEVRKSTTSACWIAWSGIISGVRRRCSSGFATDNLGCFCCWFGCIRRLLRSSWPIRHISPAAAAGLKCLRRCQPIRLDRS